MRVFLASLWIFSATQAVAWEFIPGAPCKLSASQPDLDIELTHDPLAPLFTMTLTRKTPWTDAQVFSITFVGASTFTISTDQHDISADKRTLSVADRGFGNVLRGMEFNQRAVASLGPDALSIDLADAAGPTRAFRDCPLPVS